MLAVQEVDHLLPRSGAVDQTAVLTSALAGDGPAWQGRFAAAIHGTPGSADTFVAAAGHDPTRPSYGVALTTRHPVRHWAELAMTPSRVRLPVPLPKGAGRRVLWVPDEPRVALAAVVAAPGGDVSVVTTHLSFSPLRARAQLAEVVAWCADLPRPLVLLGDLNLPPRTVAAVTGWAPAVRAATYPARKPRRQLDHVLLDGTLTATGGRAERLADSDHLALRADLRPAR